MKYIYHACIQFVNANTFPVIESEDEAAPIITACNGHCKLFKLSILKIIKDGRKKHFEYFDRDGKPTPEALKELGYTKKEIKIIRAGWGDKKDTTE